MSVILRPKNMRGRRSTVFEEGAGKRGRKRVNSQTGIQYWAALIHTSKRLKKLAKKSRVIGWGICKDEGCVFAAEGAIATI